MDASKQLRKALNSRFSQKQDELPRRAGVMGDGNGNLIPPNLSGFVYVIVGSAVETVKCDRVAPKYGALVWVGYAPEEPDLYQVLSTRSDRPNAQEGGGMGYAPAKRYEWNATGGGQDPLHVHLRAISFLKLGVSESGGMNVKLFRGNVWNGSEFVYVPTQDIDMTAHRPSTTGKAALVMVTIDTLGNVVTTKGSEVDINALARSDRPAVPDGTVFVCGCVRVYEGQTEIKEGRVNTDFDDLRFAYPAPNAGYGDPVFFVDGALIAATNVPAAVVFTRDVRIGAWYIYCKTPGSASSTIIDINLVGTGTIFSTQANRPTLAYNDPDGLALSGAPTITQFSAGDILTLDIDQVATGAADLVVVGVVSNAGSAGGGASNDYIVLKDVKTQNTSGGTATSGSWQTRDLNTEEADDGGHCTLAVNQFALAAGTYRINATVPAYAVARHQARLQNVTDATTTLLGTTEQTGTADDVTTRSVIAGQFTIATSKTFEIQHRVSSTKATSGHGLAANLASEVYTVVQLWKVA